MAKIDKKAETIVDVQQIYTKSELFVDRHRKSLGIGMGVIAAAIAGFFAYVYLYQKPRELEASNAIWKAQQYMDIDSLDWALNGNGSDIGFEQIAADYSGTKVGKQANFYCGIINRDKGEYETALNYFKDSDFDDDAIGIIALGNVGDMYVEMKQLEEGAKWLEKAGKKATSADTRRFLGPVYLLKASKVYLELGDKEKAKSLCKIITEDYKGITAAANEFGEAVRLHAMLSGQ